MENNNENNAPWPVGYLILAWIGSIIGLLGSLYFSEIKHFAPCVLCWFQRICMYPLVLLLPIGIVIRDRNVYLYALPLAIAGLTVSVYQNLLYYHIISEDLAPCVIGNSCTTKFIHLFGFLDIPQLAALGFLGMTILLLMFRAAVKRQS
jgi:disulfide bond formation protein DsbB